MKVTIFLQPSKPEMENSSPVLVLESGLEYGSSVLESVLEYSKRCTWTRTRVVAVLGLVLEYRREVLVLRLDLRLPGLGLDSFSAKLNS